MKEKSKELRDRRIEDVSWFLVAENDTEACVDVDEDANADIINGSPIADECKNDGDRFCFCGKKGLRSTKTWKYLCGECRANKPFSFKVEKPSRDRGKGRQGRKSPCEDGKRPECIDGSRPGRPTEEGGPPLCQDGSSPVCSDGSPPARPSPCADNSQPTCNGEDPVCGDGSAFQEFGPVCSKRQGKPRCPDDSVRPLCDDGSRPRGGRGGPPKGGEEVLEEVKEEEEEKEEKEVREEVIPTQAGTNPYSNNSQILITQIYLFPPIRRLNDHWLLLSINEYEVKLVYGGTNMVWKYLEVSNNLKSHNNII